MITALTRFFSSDKIIDSRILNRLGIQVLRSVGARVLYNLYPYSSTSRPQVLADLKRDGFALIPNYLPEEDFNKLEKEAWDFILKEHPSIHNRIDAANTFRYARVSDAGETRLPEATKFSKDPFVREILEAAVKSKLGDLACQFEYLIQGTHPGNHDPQADMHSDYYCNTFKAWIFLKDVELQHGPFAFVKGSQNFNLERLKWIYKESCEQNTGSRRISDEEMRASNFQESVVTLKKNTLVIVNTHGFHRRLVGIKGNDRLSIGFSARVNPYTTYFNPFLNSTR